MPLRVGIPRGLSYYYLFPFMQGFLEALGVRIVVSPPSDGRTLADMVCCPTDEPCVSVKLYFAHAKRLLEKGVDYLFVPVLSSVDKDNYCCPKLIGIADMLKNGLGLKRNQILTPEWNEREKPGFWEESLKEVAACLGASIEKAEEAIRAGKERQAFFERLTRQGLTVVEAYAQITGQGGGPRRRFDPAAEYDPSQVIGVLGHPYVLYDIVGHNLVDRLREYGRVWTAEMVPQEEISKEVGTLFEGNRMWAFEARLLGAGFYLLRRGLVNKLILMEAFSCGPASVLEAFLEAEAEARGIPFLRLTVDEHTGEAGFVTRLEAFLDTSAGEPWMSPLGSQASPGARSDSLVLNGELAKVSESQRLPVSHIPALRREELKVGAPGMGLLDIALESALAECGVEMIPTPPISKTIVELGKELAPEFICYPLVTTLGQMRAVLEKGANTIIMVGGKGRCRLGWYAQLQELLLKSKGYDFRLVIIDSPVPLKTRWKTFRQALREATGNAPLWKIAKGLYLGYHKMAALDRGEAWVRRKRAYEKIRGAADRVWRRFVRQIKEAGYVGQVKRAEKELWEELQAIPEEEIIPLRVKIIGEIYTVLESFVNQEIERFLASRADLRVEVVRNLTATQWFDLHVLNKQEARQHHQRVISAARPYLSVPVGGHGQESVGELVLAKEEGFDGVIHLLPFTCMPETVAQNIMVPLSEKLDLPLLSLIINEQTGTAGWETRLEAFLEVLAERREEGLSYGGGRFGVLLGY
ncbi:Predicted nucleotide-binding protein, sugar kinase/HSP70/actin superfamily [Thermanaeromonas toyohensis ToBE]|uniref:Predicted nucleotide-binding protein, sugar kinase/HSP70/actin superfamily n=1 Tax=Thermanaeromonas toyohensis ToBE TaxID=698762 RepID=A0A1W1VBP3_9FIRM|nr:acyl-CoA dehydratase activase-related protein [Thermanaeromonas toyohensis]SMB90610.1 Predicted nucleotide-binding protein, sugar kinase/HSP70/actin superfamily [Thermanaeromonas toyohensis ToBE]